MLEYVGKAQPPPGWSAIENVGADQCGWHVLSQALQMSVQTLKRRLIKRALVCAFCSTEDCMRWASEVEWLSDLDFAKIVALSYDLCQKVFS